MTQNSETEKDGDMETWDEDQGGRNIERKGANGKR